MLSTGLIWTSERASFRILYLVVVAHFAKVRFTVVPIQMNVQKVVHTQNFILQGLVIGF